MNAPNYKPGAALDLEELGALLEQRSDKYACPICSSELWTVWQDNNGSVTGLPWARQDGLLASIGAVPVISFTCATCGFVRQHHFEVFKAYLEKLKNDAS